MDEYIIKYLGNQAISDSNQVCHPSVERAILRDKTLIVDWVDEKRRRVLVTIKINKGDEWIGVYERGENPKEEGTITAKVFFKDDSLTIIGKLLSDSGDFNW